MSRKTDAVVARTIGIDTGKNTLHLIGLDDSGAIVLREKVSRGRIAARMVRPAVARVCRTAISVVIPRIVSTRETGQAAPPLQPTVVAVRPPRGGRPRGLAIAHG